MKAIEADELLDIEGTEKQVQWATRLRKALIGKLMKGEPSLSEADAEAVRKALLKQTQARFWIDNRDRLVEALRVGKVAVEEPLDDGWLPVLFGSEKQIAWARRIRSAYVSKLTPEARQRRAGSLGRINKASFWIENRDQLEEALDEERNAYPDPSEAGPVVDTSAAVPAPTLSHAFAAATKAKLPELEGTEKQIAWAERIRASFVGTMTESEAKAWKKTIARLKEATFWIDHREDVREGIQSEIAEPGSSKKMREERFSSSWE